MNATIRPISPADNAVLSGIVKGTLAEFGANHPGTVYYDPSTDTLFEDFQKERSHYFVPEVNGDEAGGGDMYPTEGCP